MAEEGDNNQDLSVDEILSSIRNILLDDSLPKPPAQESPLRAEGEAIPAALSEPVEDLSLRAERSNPSSFEANAEEENLESDPVFALSKTMIVPSKSPENSPPVEPPLSSSPSQGEAGRGWEESKGNIPPGAESLSEALLEGFAKIFDEAPPADIDLGREDISKETNAWLDSNLKPIAEKVIREEIERLKK